MICTSTPRASMWRSRPGMSSPSRVSRSVSSPMFDSLGHSRPSMTHHSRSTPLSSGTFTTCGWNSRSAPAMYSQVLSVSCTWASESIVGMAPPKYSVLSTQYSSKVFLSLAEQERTVDEVARAEQLVGALDQAVVHVRAALRDQAARLAHRRAQPGGDEQV